MTARVLEKLLAPLRSERVGTSRASALRFLEATQREHDAIAANLVADGWSVEDVERQLCAVRARLRAMHAERESRETRYVVALGVDLEAAMQRATKSIAKAKNKR